MDLAVGDNISSCLAVEGQSLPRRMRRDGKNNLTINLIRCRRAVEASVCRSRPRDACNSSSLMGFASLSPLDVANVSTQADDSSGGGVGEVDDEVHVWRKQNEE